MKEFTGKIAFITGGASGAGFGQAQIFSEAGMKVMIADVRQDHIDEAMEYFKGKDAQVHAIKLDVMDRDAWKSAADEVEKVYGGPPDLLVLTAGVNTFGPAEASSFEDFDWVIGVNLGGVINGLVTFVPRMIKSGKQGHIAVTDSFSIFGPTPVCAPYGASKAAVFALMESYYIALKPYGIGVSVLCPANIRSRIYEAAIKTRPEHLKNSGYNANEETQAFLAETHKFGIDPHDLAEWFKRGIENDVFLVVPYEHGEQMVQQGMSRYVDYLTPEGISRLEEKQKTPPTAEELKLMAEREGYEIKPGENLFSKSNVGFGKARSDLDWIDPDKRA